MDTSAAREIVRGLKEIFNINGECKHYWYDPEINKYESINSEYLIQKCMHCNKVKILDKRK